MASFFFPNSKHWNRFYIVWCSVSFRFIGIHPLINYFLFIVNCVIDFVAASGKRFKFQYWWMSANMKRMIPTNGNSKIYQWRQCVTVSELPSFFMMATKSNNRNWTYDGKVGSSWAFDVKCAFGLENGETFLKLEMRSKSRFSQWFAMRYSFVAMQKELNNFQ